MYSPGREEAIEVKTEPTMTVENDDDRHSTSVLRRSLSVDDSCGSDSGSQSHDEDAGTTSGSSSATNVESSTTRLHATR